jgi:uncharacterized protein with PQ loop repeat
MQDPNRLLFGACFLGLGYLLVKTKGFMKYLIHISIWAGAVLPLFNIPLILRIIKRKSADDISLTWLFGVWVCILLMSPAALTSRDIAFRAFGWTNVIFFTGVVITTVKYHHRFKKQDKG